MIGFDTDGNEPSGFPIWALLLLSALGSLLLLLLALGVVQWKSGLEST